MTEMSKIVRTITNLIFPLIMIFGLYVIAHGHLTPGGGFQGGAVVASGCALVLVAYGSPWLRSRIQETHLSMFESIGAVWFIALALLGLVFGGVLFNGVFFNNFLVGTFLFGNIPSFGPAVSDINTGGVIPLMNFAVGLKVTAGLFVIVLVMAVASRVKEWKP